MDARLWYFMVFISLAFKRCACGTTKAALQLTATNTRVFVRQEGTNIAVGQNSSQKQSLFYNDFMWTADKAVDGCYDRTSPDVSKCCSSSESAVFTENFWKVDFDVVYSLMKVVVYGRGDFGSQLDNFTVYINDTNRTPFYNSTGVPFTDGIYEIILEPEVLASSIIVTRQTGRYITLCEVEAFALPTTLPTTEISTIQTSSEATTLVPTHETTRGNSHRTTEESTKGSTQVSTESSSQSTTQGPTQWSTESSSQSSTQSPTHGSTESSSQASTEDTTQMSTDVSRQTSTQVSTQRQTYSSTDSPTQGSTTYETTYASSRGPTYVPSESSTQSSDTTLVSTQESTQMPSPETTHYSTTDPIQSTTRNSSLGQTQSATGSGIGTPAIVGITLGVLAVSVVVVIALVWKLTKSSASVAMSGIQSDKIPANNKFQR